MKKRLRVIANGLSISLLGSNMVVLPINGNVKAANLKSTFIKSVSPDESAIGLACSLSRWIQSKGNTEGTNHIKDLEDCYDTLEQQSEAAYRERDWQRLIVLTKRIIEVKEYVLGIKNHYLDSAGIGIVFEKDEVDGYPVVKDLIKGMGAGEAAIKKGAILTHINSQDIRNIGRDALIKKIRGEEGSEIAVTFRQGWVSKLVKITRKKLPGDANTNLSPFLRENSRLYMAYVKTSQIEKAIEIFPALLKSNTDRHGRNSTETAEVNFRHAKVLNISDHYQDSQKHLEEALAIAKKMSLNTLEIDIDMNSLSLSNFIGLGNFHRAKKAFLSNHRILTFHSKRLTQQKIDVLISDISIFINSGACKRVEEIGTNQCLQYTAAGYKLIEESVDHDANRNSGLLAAHASTLSDAKQREAAIKILDLLLRDPQIKPKLLLINLSLRANLLRLVGKYWEAEKDFQLAAKVATEQGGVGSVLAVHKRLDLAKHHALMGQYSKVYNFFQDVLVQLDQMSGDEETDGIRLEVYDAYVEAILTTNSFERITPIEQRIKKIITKYSNDIGAVVIGKLLQAKISVARQSFGEAALLIDEYIIGLKKYWAANKDKGAYESNGGKVYHVRSRIGDAYEILSFLQSAIGKPTLAKASMRKAIQIAQIQPAPYDYSIPRYYNTLSQIYMSNGEYRTALDIAKKALREAAKRGSEGVADSAQSNLLIGGIEAIQGRHEKASKHFDAYIKASFERLIKTVWVTPSEHKRSLSEIAVVDTNWLYQNFGTSSSLNQIALKARVNMHSLSKEVELIQGADLQILPNKLAREIEIIREKLGNKRISNSQREIFQGQINELEFQLYSSLPIQMRRVINLAEIARVLPNNGNLIEIKKYYAYPSPGKITWKNQASAKYAAFVLDRTGQVERIELGGAKEIDLQVDKVLSTSSENLADSQFQLLRLSDMILKPLGKRLRAGSKVFIVPDSKMNLVPFGALTVPDTQSPLGSHVSLRILGSGRELVVSNQQSHATAQSIVIANPDFGHTTEDVTELRRGQQIRSKRSDSKTNYLRWDLLPSTESEGRSIMNLLKGRMISGKDATTYAIKRITSPRVLHVASHGYAGGMNYHHEPHRRYQLASSTTSKADMALDSEAGFVLAGANTPVDSDDGVISLGEASSLRLNGTELVVLSACTTALGSVNDGDGVFGLQRALAIAGARSTLLSLWKVDDAATAEFMIRFYKRLKAGEGRSDALASVQREFRNGIAGKPSTWKQPYYWAAWQLVGDWRPIKDL